MSEQIIDRLKQLKIDAEEDFRVIHFLTFDEKSVGLPSERTLSKIITFDGNRNAVYSDDHFVDKSIKASLFRTEYTMFSFPIITSDFVKAIVSVAKDLSVPSAVELCCGTGWLSYWLRRYGVDCVGVDDMSWLPKVWEYRKDVVKCDAIEYVKNNKNINFWILSWPYMNDVAERIWESLKENDFLLYIGEGLNGCTATDKFHRMTEAHEIEEMSDRLNEKFVSFRCIHDRPFLFRK